MKGSVFRHEGCSLQLWLVDCIPHPPRTFYCIVIGPVNCVFKRTIAFSLSGFRFVTRRAHPGTFGHLLGTSEMYLVNLPQRLHRAGPMVTERIESCELCGYLATEKRMVL